MRISKLFLAATLFAASFSAPGARAQTFTILDDEAEAGGFDVTANLKTMPAQLALAQAENGDGYRLKLGADGIELGAMQNKKASVIARVAQKFAMGALVVQRRGSRWRVISGNRVVLEAEDDKWQEGAIGYFGGLSGVRVQPVEAITFADDFMRDAKAVRVKEAKGDETLWHSSAGTWSTSGLTENEQAQVAQTTNPFAFKTMTAGTNLALTGQLFWSDYVAEVSVKPQGASAIGLAVYAQDDKNYLLFHWSQTSMQLRAVLNGKTTLLDETPGGFDQKQWYRLKFSAAGGTLRAWVDDAEVLRGRTGLFGRGEVGLFAQAPTKDDSAVFDDVVVTSENDFYDDFSRVVAGRWQTISGAWKFQTAAQPTDARGAFAVMGESSWSDYVVSARITLPADTAAGLVLHHLTGKGAYWLRVAGSRAKLPYAGKAQIVRLAGGKTTVLGEANIGARYDGKTTAWSFTSENGYLRGSVSDDKNGDVRVVDAFDDASTKGRAGLSAQMGTTAPSLTDYQVDFPRARPTWAKVPDLYVDDKQAQTMGGWSTPQGFWLTNSGKTGALVEAGSAPPQPGETMWHKGRFWGDDGVRFPLPNIPAGQSLDLMFAAVSSTPGTSAVKTGLKLSLRTEGKNLVAEISKPGVKTTKGTLPLSGAPTDQTIEVERRGSFVIVRATGKDSPAKTLLAARVN